VFLILVRVVPPSPKVGSKGKRKSLPAPPFNRVNLESLLKRMEKSNQVSIEDLRKQCEKYVGTWLLHHEVVRLFFLLSK